MTNHTNKSNKKSNQKTSKSQNTPSSIQIPRNLQNTIGNQAMLRLMRQESPQATPSIQRDRHEHGCSCPSCARLQRQREEKQLQRALIQRDGTGTVTPSIPFSELMALWRGREQKDKPVAPVSGVHAPVVVPAGPATAAEVRGKVSSASPGSDGAAAFLAARVVELRGLNLSSDVPTQDDLIPVLAADMERKDQAKPVDERQNLSKAEWLVAARSQIEGNNTTALTTSDDRYTAIRGGEGFDELHEFIHICSGPGGESPLMNFKLQVNEGAINVFSELVAPSVGTTLVTRYTAETPVMKKLVALVGAEGIGKLFEATFKGDIDAFFDAVGAAYVALGTKKPDGKAKSYTEKNWTAAEAAAEFKSKTQAWNLKWLNERLPA
jgi:hypothetical protein